MSMRDMFDNVTLHLYEVLEKNRGRIQKTYLQYTSEPFGIYRGRQPVIPKFPCVEIVRGSVATAWGSIRVLDETYNYFLDCSIKHGSREVSEEFATTFGRAVQLILNEYGNLRFAVPGVISVTAFDSLAPSSDPSFRRAGAERTSRVTWSCKVANLVFVPGSGHFIGATKCV